MIGQMKILLRVKELKQDQAFRAMQKKRSEAAEAARAHEDALGVVAESERTLATREDAIYADVLGRVVDLDALDVTRGRVVQLEKDHTRLADDADRAAHVRKRIEDELETAVGVYKGAVKVRDKYVLITDDMKREIDEAVVYKEEAEIEDLFSRPRKGPA